MRGALLGVLATSLVVALGACGGASTSPPRTSSAAAPAAAWKPFGGFSADYPAREPRYSASGISPQYFLAGGEPTKPWCITAPVPSGQQPAKYKSDAYGSPLMFIDGRWHYHPVSNAAAGLNDEGAFLKTGEKRYADLARRLADGLVHRQDAETGAWYYPFDWPITNTGTTAYAPWPSTLAQGQAISLLTRVYRRTRDPRYLDAALNALKPFAVPPPRGVLVRLRGRPFYEEYPTTKPNFTLNGFMFSLLGLYDLASVAPRSQALPLFRQGMATLEASLPLYNIGGKGAYDLGHRVKRGVPVNWMGWYQCVEVVLLAALNDVSPSPVLRRYHDLWRRYVPRTPSGSAS